MARRLTEQKILDLVRDLKFEPLKITVEKHTSGAAGRAASGDLTLQHRLESGRGKVRRRRAATGVSAARTCADV